PDSPSSTRAQVIVLALEGLLRECPSLVLDCGEDLVWVIGLRGMDDDPETVMLGIDCHPGHALDVLAREPYLLLDLLQFFQFPPGLVPEPVHGLLAEGGVEEVGDADGDEALGVARHQVKVAGDAATQYEPQRQAAADQQDGRRRGGGNPDPQFRLLGPAAPPRPLFLEVLVLEVLVLLDRLPGDGAANRLLGL